MLSACRWICRGDSMEAIKFARASATTHRRVPGSLLLWFALNRDLFSVLGFSCSFSVREGYDLL